MTFIPSQPVRIIVIAGEGQDRQKVIDILDKSTFAVTVEISLEQDLKSYSDNYSLQDKYDILVWQIEPNNIKFLKILGHIHSKNLLLPIIVITTNRSIEITVKAIKAGADDFITISARTLNRLPQFILSAIDYHSHRLDLVSPMQTEAKLRSFADEIVRKNEALAEARDKALEASRLKSEYLATMGHEIRTPMNAMTGMAELLLDTSLTQEQREYVAIMRDSSQVLLTLINDILDFSKIEAGKLALEMIDFSPLEAIESIGDLFSMTASQKKLDLVIYVSPQVPPMVRGDPVRLRQVLTNLVSNAIKFTQSGEVEVHTDLLEETEKFVMLLFQVRDTGIGISEENLANLFQPFTQADTSTTRKYGGTGLGLAISKRLVELMDGEISVNTIVGKGSTFWFTATFEKSDLNTITPEQKPDFGFVGLKALVVDESGSSRQVINRYLELLEMKIYECSSLSEGIQSIEAAVHSNEPFQVIIVGIKSSSSENSSLAPEIAQFSKASQAHLVFLSPSGQRRLGDEAIEMGFSACLSKPVKRNNFLETIRNLISGKSVLPPVVDHSIPATLPEGEKLWKESDIAAENHHNLILLAEDNLTNQRLITLQLQKLGYECEVVSTGREAVLIASENPGRYMLILMDLQMPDLDGIKATQLIHENEKKGSHHVPIIAVSASSLEKDREASLKAGMDDYITKPAMLGDLHRVIQKWRKKKDHIISSVSAANPIADKMPLLDPSILTEIRSLQLAGQPDVLTEIIDIYLADSAKYLETIQIAVEKNDETLLKKGTHSLRGSSGNIGARSLASRCEVLENLALSGNLESAKALLLLLEAEYRLVCKALATEKVV